MLLYDAAKYLTRCTLGCQQITSSKIDQVRKINMIRPARHWIAEAWLLIFKLAPSSMQKEHAVLERESSDSSVGCKIPSPGPICPQQTTSRAFSHAIYHRANPNAKRDNTTDNDKSSPKAALFLHDGSGQILLRGPSGVPPSILSCLCPVHRIGVERWVPLSWTCVLAWIESACLASVICLLLSPGVFLWIWIRGLSTLTVEARRWTTECSSPLTQTRCRS